MIKEDYVSFEVAKLLKDKEFDEHCFCINYPLLERGHHSIILPNLLNNSMIPFINEYKFCRYKEDFITIPTLQMAMKWLREVHKLYIEITPSSKTNEFIVDSYRIDIVTKTFDTIYVSSGYDTYEQACEAAIKYCLENLI